MSWATVKLKPGVVTQYTPVLNEAGVSVSDQIRYHDGLIQKLGGWSHYYSGTISSTIREIHGWSGLLGNKYLAVGATGNSTSGQALGIITAGSYNDITPQTHTSSFAPDFSISSGDNTVTIKDVGSSASVNDVIYFNTPISLGTILLDGAYPIDTIISASSYTIEATAKSCTTIVSSGELPLFTSIANSATVTVTLANHNYSVINGLFHNFIAPSTVGGRTIQGPYEVNTVTSSTAFTIVLSAQTTAAQTSTMNAGLAQIVYWDILGPPQGSGGYGLGGYGLGGYGIGSTASGGGAGTPITATDWSLDNWGSILLACPKNGPIYAWGADLGFATAYPIPTAPFFNGGIFVSQPQQILVAWNSCQSTGVQDPMKVRWSGLGDYTNWTVNSQTGAGGFTIPVGSKIMGGMQAGLRGIIWTDIDVWIMQYVGGDVTFNFTRVGTGCGLISKDAAGVVDDRVFWMGNTNIFVLDNGADVVSCPVWDFVFQNLHPDYTDNIMCAVNSLFNEITWYFPSLASTGQNDAYIKYNTQEGEWDFGYLQRVAWDDISALGNPIGCTITEIFQHETSNDADFLPMNPSFETGYFTLAEGEDMVFVDYVVPDMKFGTYGSSNAAVEITINTVDYPGDTPRTYGPVTFTSTTEYLNPRLRGRFMNLALTSNDAGTFWRIGGIKYRYGSAGRR